MPVTSATLRPAQASRVQSAVCGANAGRGTVGVRTRGTRAVDACGRALAGTGSGAVTDVLLGDTDTAVAWSTAAAAAVDEVVLVAMGDEAVGLLSLPTSISPSPLPFPLPLPSSGDSGDGVCGLCGLTGAGALSTSSLW